MDLTTDVTTIQEKRLNKLKSAIVSNTSTSKRTSYVGMNPGLEIHPVYSSSYIQEHKRICFNRYRLSSHRLKIETGRWSGIQRENRLCSCGNNIQDETHMLLECVVDEGYSTENRLKSARCIF